MKIICQQKELERALDIVSKAVKGNSTLPVLDNILVKTEARKLYFFSTNLEIAIECSISADVKNEGSITVPAKLFHNYISLLKNDSTVELSVSNGTDFYIKTQTSETKIKGIKAEDFPGIPKVEKEGVFEVSPEIFSESITQSSFASSLNTTRPVLSGVYFNVGKTELKMVATDSYRLAEKKLKIEHCDTSIEEFIVPFTTMVEVGRIFTKGEKNIEVIISKNQVQFLQDSVRLISRLIEGKFPEYNQIIPKKYESRSTLKAQDFLLGIKRVSLFAKENSYNIRLDVKQEGVLEISSNVTEIGEGRTEINCNVEGKDSAIALNAQYLIDFLNNIKEEELYFDIDSKLTPAVLRPKKKTDDYVYLVMPLKLD